MSGTVQTLEVALGERSYPVHVGSGLLRRAAELLQPGRRPLWLLSDRHVAPLYAGPLAAALGIAPDRRFIVRAGERSKSWTTLQRLLDAMLRAGLPRDGVLVALGGGVVGDLGGFASAIFQRGIDFVQVPTTLLAMVDSSVGGKTGINHASGKNLIGAFHQPVAVLADLDTLKTLPGREFRAGLAEVYKYGLLGDVRFLDWLDASREAIAAHDPDALREMVLHCCRMKAEIVAADEREAGRRALLNLGHTFGHAMEAYVGFRGLLHGEAVAVGMRIAIRLSAALGRLAPSQAREALALLDRAGLPDRIPDGMQAADFLRLMAADKKVRDGRLRLVLLDQVGRAVVTADYDDAVLARELAQVCAAGRA